MARGGDNEGGSVAAAEGGRGPTGARMRRLLTCLLVAAGIMMIAAAGLGVAVATGVLGGTRLVLILTAVAVVLALFSIVGAFWVSDEFFRQIERLRGAIVMLAGSESAVLPKRAPGSGGLEIDRLYWALSGLVARYARERAAPDERLRAVLSTISEAMLVITDAGQVSLVNQAARQLLGADRVKVGTSVYAALERGPVIEAVNQADRKGQPVRGRLRTVDGDTLEARIAGLGDHGGAVLSFDVGEEAARIGELEHDLALHDAPPAHDGVSDDTRLEELPVVILDTETTGLDVSRERVISIGAVRAHGNRIYPRSSIDRLVDPGIPIPSRSTAVHGITDEMVGDAPSYPTVHEELVQLLDGCVMAGHNIAFDRAILRRECELAGLAWPEPPLLDTLLLAAALDPSKAQHSLEALAADFGVDIHGRHTALGDALVTAEVFVRMLPRLQDAGVATLGDAKDFSARARDLAKAQKDSGW